MIKRDRGVYDRFREYEFCKLLFFILICDYRYFKDFCYINRIQVVFFSLLNVCIALYYNLAYFNNSVFPV